MFSTMEYASFDGAAQSNCGGNFVQQLTVNNRQAEGEHQRPSIKAQRSAAYAASHHAHGSKHSSRSSMHPAATTASHLAAVRAQRLGAAGAMTDPPMQHGPSSTQQVIMLAT
jgi:hypothetical protein